MVISRKLAPRLFLLLLVFCIAKTALVKGLDDGSSSSTLCPDSRKDFFCGDDDEPQCISAFKRCDNIKDCANGKDEMGCDYLHECPEGDFICRDGGACLSPSFRCNGQFDCMDGSDELGCDDKPGPPQILCLPPDNFLCKRENKCILSSARCDGKNDCESGEDEKNCLPNICLEKNSFKCVDGSACLHEYQVCNGVVECPDGSDERDCANDLPSSEEFEQNDYLFCKDNEFQCSDGRCIADKKVCDGVSDCQAGDDEGGLCGQCESYGCGGQCKNFPTGPKCSCPSEMLLSVDEKTCRYPNLCESNNQKCAQYCQQDESGIKCTCSEGYDLDDDNAGCVLKQEFRNGTLFFLNGNKSVRKSDIFNTTGFTIYNEFVPQMLNSTNHISSLAFDQNMQRLYFVGVENHQRYASIFSSDGKSGIESLFQGLGLKHVAYDWVGKNIYYASNGLGIGACSSDGKYCSHLISGRKFVAGEIVQDYGDLIVHPKRGLLIWLEYNSDYPNGVVMSAGMDGSKPRIVYRGSTTRLTAIAMDYVMEALQIADAEQQLVVMDLNTLRRKVLRLKSVLSSMLHFDGALYFVSRENKYLTRFKGDKADFLCRLHGDRFPVAINSSVYYEPISSPCDDLHCSHLCVLNEAIGNVPLTAKCICPDKYSVVNDGSCIYDRQIDGPVKTSSQRMETLCNLDDTAACLNGGFCSDFYENYKGETPSCNCIDGFTGLYCELSSFGQAMTEGNSSSGWLALLFFIFVVLPLAGLLAFCSVRRYPDVAHGIANFVHSLSERFNSNQDGEMSTQSATRDISPRSLLKNDVEAGRGGDATTVNIPHNFSNPAFQRMNEESIERDVQSSFPLFANKSPSSSPTF